MIFLSMLKQTQQFCFFDKNVYVYVLHADTSG